MMPTTKLVFAVVAIALAQFSARAEQPSQSRQAPLGTDAALLVLQDSDDPSELERAAVSLSNAEPGAVDVLVQYLTNDGFLRRLDPDEDYKFHVRRLRVKRVLASLGDAGTEKAQRAILSLANNSDFSAHHARVDGLVDALGAVKTPIPEVLAYLDGKAVPKGTYLFRAIRALVRIGTLESHMLLEKRVLSKTYDVRSITAWFTEVVVEVRYEPGVLDMYDRLLARGIRDTALRNTIVQTLFDYRPRDWYKPSASYPKPQSLADAGQEALAKLLSLVGVAEGLDLSIETQTAVQRARADIEKLLA